MNDPETTRGSDPQPIDEDEAKGHIVYLRTILEADNADERKAPLAEAFLRYGLRFIISLQYLKQEEGDPGAAKFGAILDESHEMFLEWLAGERISDRADEPERRAVAAKMVLDAGLEDLKRLAAQAILALPEGHPLRDEDAAKKTLIELYDDALRTGDATLQILVIRSLIEYNLASPERQLDLIAEGKEVVNQVEDSKIRRNFWVIAMQVYGMRVIDTRNDEDKTDCLLWQELAAAACEQLQQIGGPERLQAKNLLSLATIFASADEPRKAADHYRDVLEIDDADMSTHLIAAQIESRFRLRLSEYERVVEALTPLAREFETAYLAAIDAREIESAGDAFTEVMNNLAFACAFLDRWGEAVKYLEHSKSLRLRYQSTVRTRPEGRPILDLERRLHALSRGVAIQDLPASTGAAEDWLRKDISAHASVLEEYRKVRPSLPDDVLAAPSIGEIAAQLADYEAVLSIGTGQRGTMLGLIRSGDTGHPSACRIIQECDEVWIAELITRNQGGWSMVLDEDPEAPDPRSELKFVLEQIDAHVGRFLEEALRDSPVRRVTIIPAFFYFLVPLWALPSLARFDVKVSASAAHFFRSSQPGRPATRKALVAGNPTLDLPFADFESVEVARRLHGVGIDMETFSRSEATQDTLEKAMESSGILHFAGHGRTAPLEPLESALLVHPDWEKMPVEQGEGLEALAEKVETWREVDEDTREARIPGVGRLVERLNAKSRNVIERSLDYAEKGTLLNEYGEGGPLRCAEMWTAGDLMVSSSVMNCSLAFLSACSTGLGGMLSHAERAGLPAALQMAGISTVVCSLWPVSDRFTALYVDLFYEALAAAEPSIDVATLVRQVGRQLQKMKRETAAEHVEQLAATAEDLWIELQLSAYAEKLKSGDAEPFRFAYDWASFYVVGAGRFSFSLGG
ncbi:MAG: CHAT domain-containing protein [Pseudomonadota bacterium]|nr:CHAT domain-containing protein [Pseudomonadota bacterium]